MKAKMLVYSSLLFIAIVAMSYEIPIGWVRSGTQPDKYDMGTDVKAGENGMNAATIKSIERHIKGYGSLKQILSADNYKGKRVRLTGNIKTRDVENASGYFLRIEGEVVRPFDGRKIKTKISEDDMFNRNLKGTTDWTKCEMVLDVPDTAAYVVYGVYLNGTGQIWFDNLKFDIVGNDVPATSRISKTPTNLDFEK